MSSLRIALATKMTEGDNDWLRLQKLKVLDEKQLQAQRHFELYQPRIMKAFNKKGQEESLSERRFGFSSQAVNGHDT